MREWTCRLGVFAECTTPFADNGEAIEGGNLGCTSSSMIVRSVGGKQLEDGVGSTTFGGKKAFKQGSTQRDMASEVVEGEVQIAAGGC